MLLNSSRFDIKWACLHCDKSTHHNSYSIKCTESHEWFHLNCTNVRKEDLRTKSQTWNCNKYSSCTSPSSFRPAISRVRVVSLREGSPSLMAAELRPTASWSNTTLWENVTAEEVKQMNDIYEEVVHWRPRFIRLSRSKAANMFTDEITAALDPLAGATSHSSYSMKAAMILPHLTLARTKKSSTSTHATIARRITMWNQGNINELLVEARALESTLPVSRRRDLNQDSITDPNRFTEQIKEGKIGKAKILLEENPKRGVLRLSDQIDGKSAKDILESKHVEAKPQSPDCVLQDSHTLSCHPSIFHEIDENLTKQSQPENHRNARTIRLGCSSREAFTVIIRKTIHKPHKNDSKKNSNRNNPHKMSGGEQQLSSSCIRQRPKT